MWLQFILELTLLQKLHLFKRTPYLFYILVELYHFQDLENQYNKIIFFFLIITITFFFIYNYLSLNILRG